MKRRISRLGAAIAVALSFSPVVFAQQKGASESVSWLAGKRLDQLKSILPSDRQTPHLLSGAATLLDDQDGGSDSAIDPGYETLYLATYLSHQVGSALGPRFDFSQAAVEAYRAKMLPNQRSTNKLATQLRFDAEGADLARRSHQDKTAELWKSHFDNNKKRILSAAMLMQKRKAGAKGRPLVVVLGAGSCADIPLRELVAMGNDVVLVDLDEASLKAGIAMQVDPADRRHVQLELRDLTEGAIDAITAAAAEIIERHTRKQSSAALARQDLMTLFKEQRVSVPHLEGLHKADLLVSSLLMSQLPVFPSEEIGARFERAFKEPLARTDEDRLSLSLFGDRLFDAHIEALGDFVTRYDAVVYFSSDMYFIPSFYDVDAQLETYGAPMPVVGYHGKPLPDLDDAFRGNRHVQVISESHSKKPGSDFWLWNQAPAELAKRVEFVRKRSGHDGPAARMKKGFVRSVDSVILVPP